MPARFRRVDFGVSCALVVVLVAVGSTMLATVGPSDDLAVCSANLRLFGQASAGYVATYGVFAPCDPWGRMPSGFPGGPWRSGSDWTQVYDPAQGWLLHYMGYVPFVPVSDPDSQIWYQVPYGFRKASLWGGPSVIPPPAICPALNATNIFNYHSPEMDVSTFDAAGYYYQHGAGYMIKDDRASA